MTIAAESAPTERDKLLVCFLARDVVHRVAVDRNTVFRKVDLQEEPYQSTRQLQALAGRGDLLLDRFLPVECPSLFSKLVIQSRSLAASEPLARSSLPVALYHDHRNPTGIGHFFYLARSNSPTHL